MPPGNGQGKPPDWIPPGLRPEDEGLPSDELHGDWYWGDDDLAGEAKPFAGKASGGFYQIEWVSPGQGAILPTTSLIVTVKPTSNDGTLMTVEVQYATDPSFAAPTTVTLTNRTSGVQTTATLSPLTDMQTYYLRARSGGSGNWSAWAGTFSIEINTGVGNALEYVLVNNGVLVPDVQHDALEYVLANLGFEPPVALGHAWEYILIGDVNTDTPTPVIWGMFPTSGREGDGFTIYGHGFGATAGTYSGQAIMEMDPDVILSVSAWVQVASGAHAYDSLRELDLSDSPPTITMEHQRIDVTVPNGAVPPGYPVRVDTNGA